MRFFRHCFTLNNLPKKNTTCLNRAALKKRQLIKSKKRQKRFKGVLKKITSKIATVSFMTSDITSQIYIFVMGLVEFNISYVAIKTNAF